MSILGSPPDHLALPALPLTLRARDAVRCVLLGGSSMSVLLMPDEAVALASHCQSPLGTKARPARDWLYNRIVTVGNIGPLYICSDECPLSTHDGRELR